MKRLVIVYNPRSTRFLEIEREVIEPARKLKGWMVLKFEVQHRAVEEEAKRLAEIVRKGDLVLATGGDGTAGMVLNAILLSGKLATMGVLPFGNFNDFSTTVGEMKLAQVIKGFEAGKYREFYPMEVRVDGRHFLYVGMYFTVGMLAEAAGLFEDEKVRKKLGKARNRLEFSARKTFGWYVKNKRRRDFLKGCRAIGGERGERLERGEITDYIAMNGGSMAGVVETDGWFENGEVFRSGAMRNRSLTRMFRAFLRTLEGEMPGEDVREEVLTLTGEPVWVNIEGEARKIEGAREIRIRKTGEKVRVVAV